MTIPAVQIETTSACNARCVFCFRGSRNGSPAVPAKTMTDEVFRKIVDENPSNNYILYLLGDPLCDPKLPERVAYIREKNVRAEIFFHTNGGLLTTEKIDALIDAGLSHMYVSCYGLGALHDELQPGVGMAFDHIAEMVEYMTRRGLLVRIVSNNVDPRLVAVRPEAENFWRARGVAAITTDSEVMWGDGTNAGEGSLPANSNRCNIACGHRVFGSDGSFLTCCLDWKRRNTFGNVAAETWEEGVARLLEAYRAGRHLPFCTGCPFEDSIDLWAKAQMHAR